MCGEFMIGERILTLEQKYHLLESPSLTSTSSEMPSQSQALGFREAGLLILKIIEKELTSLNLGPFDRVRWLASSSTSPVY